VLRITSVIWPAWMESGVLKEKSAASKVSVRPPLPGEAAGEAAGDGLGRAGLAAGLAAGDGDGEVAGDAAGEAAGEAGAATVGFGGAAVGATGAGADGWQATPPNNPSVTISPRYRAAPFDLVSALIVTILPTCDSPLRFATLIPGTRGSAIQHGACRDEEGRR
jgi:hypothetical protein